MDAGRVVFLGGLGRSGTTLLERLLAQLPGVVALGEVVHLWERGLRRNEPCGCGVAFLDCQFWRNVGDRAFGGWDRLDVAEILRRKRRVDRIRRIPWLACAAVPAARIGGRRSAVADYAHLYLRLYAAASAVSGRPVVIDSSKHASLAFCLRTADPAFRVAHVVRDSRGVAHSWAKRVERPEDGAPMTRWPPLRTGIHWLVENLAFELLSRRGVPVTPVRYEELLRAPRATLAHLAGKLGLRCDDGALDFVGTGHAELSVAHTVSGNPLRFRTGRVDLRSDQAWRSRLPRLQRATVTVLTWPLLSRYGYRGSPL
ncbi:sulfotransferase [Rhizohabitans arisaemae]|uniref:sulfotransferase n=1 Tax=Rhizohabitans arisaemae TaxID=2720610 RepID=UPI0024B226A2|nr:sulfotransferase [Rhizohabitans arisaemae]